MGAAAAELSLALVRSLSGLFGRGAPVSPFSSTPVVEAPYWWLLKVPLPRYLGKEDASVFFAGFCPPDIFPSGVPNGRCNKQHSNKQHTLPLFPPTPALPGRKLFSRQLQKRRMTLPRQPIRDRQRLDATCPFDTFPGQGIRILFPTNSFL